MLFGSAHFDDMRPSLFFSNPNQLGYYAVLMLSIYIVTNKLNRVNLPLFLLVFFLCIFSAMLSASKAAVGGAVFLLIVYLIDSKITSFYNVLAIILISSIGYFYVAKNEHGIKRVSYILNRVEDGSKAHGITEWEYRGYDRISNHPSYLVLGAGEGMYQRFNSYIGKHEIHSSIGTIAFCYGIPGTLFFGFFAFSLFKGIPIKLALYAVPVFLYSLTHQGLRFTPLWILLALFPLIRHIGIYLRTKEKETNVSP